MPLPNIQQWANRVSPTAGSDKLELCQDEAEYKEYPHSIEYRHNSRGFRDDEWPDTLEELTNAIWCVGDSYTSGIGVPAEHSWVNVLQEKTGRRCIRISIPAGSNSWMARQIKNIVDEVNPRDIVVQWSMLGDKETPDDTLSDLDRRDPTFGFGPHSEYNYEYQITNFRKVLDTVTQYKNLIHTFIPESGYRPSAGVWDKIKDASWPSAPSNFEELEALPADIINELKYLHEENIYDVLSLTLLFDSWFEVSPIIVDKIDIGRDGSHYDIKTSTKFVNELLEQNPHLMRK
jgi:hypothetical protein